MRYGVGAVYTHSLTADGKVVVIVDHHDHYNNAKSVTNDVENVIEDIRLSGIDFTGRRVVYRDTEGMWDELVIKDNAFSGFKPIGVHSLDDAIKLMGKQ